MNSTQIEQSTVDVVVPLFNEIEIVEQLHTRLVASCEQTGLCYRIVYVDDGSHDGTPQWIREHAIRSSGSFDVSNLDSSTVPISARSESTNQSTSGEVTLLELSRNFGQPAAILAGLKHTTAGSVVIMDGDLQDPPELIPEMVERWQEGDQVVIAQRTGRKETFARGLAFKAFHSLFKYMSDSNIPANTGTFLFVGSRCCRFNLRIAGVTQVLSRLTSLGWIQSVDGSIQNVRHARAASRSKLFCDFLRTRWTRFFGYSFKPLRLLTAAGCAICCLAFCHRCLVYIQAGGWMGNCIDRIYDDYMCDFLSKRLSVGWLRYSWRVHWADLRRSEMSPSVHRRSSVSFRSNPCFGGKV